MSIRISMRRTAKRRKEESACCYSYHSPLITMNEWMSKWIDRNRWVYLFIHYHLAQWVGCPPSSPTWECVIVFFSFFCSFRNVYDAAYYFILNNFSSHRRRHSDRLVVYKFISTKFFFLFLLQTAQNKGGGKECE